MKTTKARKTAFFIIISLFYMAASFAHPVTPTLIKRLNLQDYMFGLALALMMLSNFLFSPFWGKMSSYIGSRNTLLISCVGYGVAQIMFAFAQTQGQFLFARFFAGIFVGGCFTGILTYIVNTAPDEKLRGKWLVTSATLQAVFNSIGYFVGGMLGEVHVYVSVVVQAITLVACGVLFRILCTKDAEKPNEKISAKVLVKQANPFYAFSLGKQFMTVTFALLFAVCALQNFSQTAFDQSFNYYVIDQIGLSTGYNGLIKGVMGIVTLIANSTLCVWLMTKTNTKKSIIYVLMACGLSIGAVVFIKDLWPFLVVNILFYALSSISVPIIQDLVASADKKQNSNMVMGFYNAIKSFGGIIGALLAGFTYIVSPLTPFVFCALGFVVATVCAVFYQKRSAKC